MRKIKAYGYYWAIRLLGDRLNQRYQWGWRLFELDAELSLKSDREVNEGLR